MSRHKDLQRVLDGGIVAIVTFTVPGVLDIIREVRRSLGDKILLGAGTVLDTETARAALLAGAEFVVSPVVNLDVIRLCHRYDKLVMPGAFTPTEILTAWEAGADIVKVFPADSAGPAYLKALRGPLPQVRLLPTGGVNLETLADFVHAGACAVGLGSALVEKQALETGDMARIRDLAGRYVSLMRSVRSA
jgi:2-dehydro-3-deoxyphosphogluconate aldolase/(4S)-4-hydroxy-2-oxoglutarate aldolase